MAKKAYVWDGTAWQEITSDSTIPVATTSSAGIVQLVDSVASVSTVSAAVPNSVKTAYDAAVAAQATADAAVTPTGTQTLSNKTLTAPKFGTDGEIDDINGNELIKFPSTVASAVNEVTISNAAAAAAPSISASGTDTNIDLSLVPKGTGNVSATKLRLSSTTSAGTTSTEHAFQIGPTSGFNLRVDSGSIQAVSNGNANTNFSLQPNGGSVTLGSQAATTLIINKAGGLRISDTISELNYVELKPPSTGAGASYTLPGTAPATSGQVLSSTTAGVMSWTDLANLAVTNAGFEAFNFGASGVIGTIPRFLLSGSNTPASGTVIHTRIVPHKDFIVSNITFTTATNATSGATLIRFGIYTRSGTTFTLVARTASDATMFNTAIVKATRALNTTGGYPATYTMTAGNEYFISQIQVATTRADIVTGTARVSTGANLATGGMQYSQTSQTDLPASSTGVLAATSGGYYAEVS